GQAPASMNANDPNVSLLEIVAEKLGDALRDQMVFVGGAVAGLLITDPAMPAIRPTEDVDMICRALVRADYYRVEAALRRYLGERFHGLLAMRGFIDTVAGHLPGDAASQERLPDLLGKLGLIAQLRFP
ncbi:MAG: hypothetical protein ACR2I0_09585, partial [Rhodoferax sp.]